MYKRALALFKTVLVKNEANALLYTGIPFAENQAFEFQNDALLGTQSSETQNLVLVGETDTET